MRTLPILDALHALPSTLSFRQDLTRLARPLGHVRPTHVNLSGDVIDAVCFATPTGPVWAGLQAPWSPDGPAISTPDERRVQPQPDFSGWTRAELRTGLTERPGEDDPWHQAMLRALAEHLNHTTLF